MHGFSFHLHNCMHLYTNCLEYNTDSRSCKTMIMKTARSEFHWAHICILRKTMVKGQQFALFNNFRSVECEKIEHSCIHGLKMTSISQNNFNHMNDKKNISHSTGWLPFCVE